MTIKKMNKLEETVHVPIDYIGVAWREVIVYVFGG